MSTAPGNSGQPRSTTTASGRRWSTIAVASARNGTLARSRPCTTSGRSGFACPARRSTAVQVVDVAHAGGAGEPAGRVRRRRCSLDAPDGVDRRRCSPWSSRRRKTGARSAARTGLRSQKPDGLSSGGVGPFDDRDPGSFLIALAPQGPLGGSEGFDAVSGVEEAGRGQPSVASRQPGARARGSPPAGLRCCRCRCRAGRQPAARARTAASGMPRPPPLAPAMSSASLTIAPVKPRSSRSSDSTGARKGGGQLGVDRRHQDV